MSRGLNAENVGAYRQEIPLVTDLFRKGFPSRAFVHEDLGQQKLCVVGEREDVGEGGFHPRPCRL